MGWAGAETPQGAGLMQSPRDAKPPSILPLLALALLPGSFPGLHLFTPFPFSRLLFLL